MESYTPTLTLQPLRLNASVPVKQAHKNRIVVGYVGDKPVDITVWPTDGAKCVELQEKYSENVHKGIMFRWYRR